MQTIGNKERRIFVALTKLQEATVSEIAEETLLNRTALYHTLKKLIRNGLVNTVRGERGNRYRAIAFSDFERWADEQVASTIKNITAMRKEIECAVAKTPSLRTDVRYFEGHEALSDLYADTWRDNPDGEILAITDYSKAYEVMGDFFNDIYFKDRINHGVHVKSLLPKSREGLRDQHIQAEMLREMRYIDLFKTLGIEINIYAEKVAIVSFDTKQPSGIIIRNEVINRAFRHIFKNLWKQSAST